MNRDIAIILINAVVTMLTTAIVIRLSLNQGKLGITNKFKDNARGIIIKYGYLLFFLILISNTSYEIYKFAIETKPITRLQIVSLSMNFVLFMTLMILIMLELIIYIKRNKNS